MKLKAVTETVLKHNGFALIGHNGDEVVRVSIEGGGDTIARQDFERIEAALVALINRDGLEVEQ